MIPVVKWSGREARALRNARRMGVRQFAKHLGYTAAAVSYWEARGSDANLRQNTQEVLDADLALAPEDVRGRFEQALKADEDEMDSDTLGTSSSARTRDLLPQLRTQFARSLDYQAPDGVTGRVRDFLRSSARVYLLAGPAGVGKTRLVYQLVTELAGAADFQLHTVGSWEIGSLDLAVEILRYSSVPKENDALLTLEAESARLRRPCLVVIDGISSQSQFDRVGRQLDTILRQVTTGWLRFLLVLRTPPAVETRAHPVLNAAIFDPPSGRDQGPQHLLGPWDTVTARQIWNSARAGDGPPFEHLPASVQQLTRLPLYMQLVLTSGDGTAAADGNAYRLIDHCVHAILRAEGQDSESVIAELSDIAARQTADLVPAGLTVGALRDDHDTHRDEHGRISSAVLVRTPAGRVEFTHDVLREYFLATRIAGLLRDRGRLVPTVGALNHLADQAVHSAAARTLFELVIHCLDDVDRDLLGLAAMSPTIATGTTLPLMLSIAGDSGRFATPDVLRACAQRCDQDTALELARALLATSAVYPALGSDCPQWLLSLLRRFGAAIWRAVMTFIELNLDAAAVRILLDLADLDMGAESIFFARYYFLFIGDDSVTSGALERLLEHESWRVRAGLAEALRDEHSPPTGTSRTVMDRLVADADYKVRAAAALSLHRVTPAPARRYLTTLLTDENWHVRERVLHDLLTAPRPPRILAELADTAAAAIAAEPSWARCPAHVRPMLQRLRLTHGPHDAVDDSAATGQALFAMLRETRTGWTSLPKPVFTAVVEIARRSPNWLVVREAAALDEPVAADPKPGGLDDPRMYRESFRRRRGHRSLQVALDMHDLDDALIVARAAGQAGVDFVEVGDPLIKRVGLRAVERVKREIPDVLVVAEMMSADWGRDQVVLAAEAGADVVQLIGPATIASVAAAVEAGHRLGVPIVLDAPTALLTQPWVAAMERAGVDGFTVTTNIDVGIGSRHSLATARSIRGWTQLPVAVSGGFSAADQTIITSRDWDILIVGRSVADAVDPGGAARRIAESVRDHDEGSR
ncbi:orotidine 5'-phosphate decarboxylase / HUMPS family protein [Amycolatopsis sp. RTGN1]|uniref:orotidine 5'-phosphate decarboxylase / HUMPS family protein n=1 Tax=Amycolatopsis ponsaeliensis TaxID=2992142 RepID=UPI002550BBF4|nr:orotidine 5'-phosphate decarboxylase / HUMPS family protein [Amycolatopsis sp. RTGN1]